MSSEEAGSGAHDLITLIIAVDRFNDGEIDIVDARRLIMPLFGLSADDCSQLHLVDELDKLLDQLRADSLSPTVS